MTPTERKAVSWLFGGDTGTSSQAICSFMLLGKVTGYGWGPADSGDFGRCHRLLECVPAFRKRLPEMVSAGGDWAKLIPVWDELTALYVGKKDRELHDRIKVLTRAPSVRTSGPRTPRTPHLASGEHRAWGLSGDGPYEVWKDPDPTATPIFYIRLGSLRGEGPYVRTYAGGNVTTTRRRRSALFWRDRALVGRLVAAIRKVERQHARVVLLRVTPGRVEDSR